LPAVVLRLRCRPSAERPRAEADLVCEPVRRPTFSSPEPINPTALFDRWRQSICMLRRLSVARPPLLRTPTPPLPQLALAAAVVAGSARPLSSGSRAPTPQHLSDAPLPSTSKQTENWSQPQAYQQQMISPPPSPSSSSSRPPVPSVARLISPSTVEEPPPDLTDAQLRQATVDLYADPTPYSAEELARPETHGGPYAQARSRLDYAYHRKPTVERRRSVRSRALDGAEPLEGERPEELMSPLTFAACHRLQDQIVSQVLAQSHKEECRFCHAADDDSPSAVNDSNDKPKACSSPARSDRQPVALFTSGGMGAGKGHVLRTFLEDGRIRLEDNFVWCVSGSGPARSPANGSDSYPHTCRIDPDKISRILPERPLYLAANPDETATLLHAESSVVQELLTDAARSARRSVVIDGSLSCSDWFRQVMHDFRSAGYLVEVLFVFCTDEDTMWARAERRRLKTGRRVSREQIRKSRLQSPASVAELSSPSSSATHRAASIDRLRLVDNSSDDPESGQPEVVYDSRDDSSWQDGIGGEVDVVRIALGNESAKAKARI
jgi:hypothetical protein